MLERAAKFAKRARSETRYFEFNRVTSFDGMMDGGMPCCMKQKSHKNGIERSEKMVFN